MYACVHRLAYTYKNAYNKYLYTYIYIIYIHTYIQRYIHTYLHTYINTYLGYIHINTHIVRTYNAYDTVSDQPVFHL